MEDHGVLARPGSPAISALTIIGSFAGLEVTGVQGLLLAALRRSVGYQTDTQAAAIGREALVAACDGDLRGRLLLLALEVQGWLSAPYRFRPVGDSHQQRCSRHARVSGRLCSGLLSLFGMLAGWPAGAAKGAKGEERRWGGIDS
jgi:hypothetical protein